MAKEIDVKHLAIVGPRAEKIDGKFYVTLASGEKRGPFPYMVDMSCQDGIACVMTESRKYKYIAFDGKESEELDIALPFSGGYATVIKDLQNKNTQNIDLLGNIVESEQLDKFTALQLSYYLKGIVSLEEINESVFEKEGVHDFIRRVEVNKMDYNYTKRLLNRRMKKVEVDAKITKRVLEVDEILQTQREKIAKRKSIEEIKLGR